VFLCCGDALFDLFIGPNSSGTDVELAGDVGGSPLNVAVGLARLGNQSRFLTRLSSDLFGQRMRAYLRQNNIDTSLCTDTSQNTTLAIVETQDDGSARYVFYTDNTADASLAREDLPTPLPADVAILHVASYSTVLPITGKTLLKFVQRESGHRAISYDPNLRLMVQPDVSRWQETFQNIASHAFVVKASDEDVDALFGVGEYDAFFQRCFDLGVQVVFLTRGPDGALAADCKGQKVDLPGVPIDVLDTVGAGDTFQAAILHWLAHYQHISTNKTGRKSLAGVLNLEQCVRFALHAAALTCTRRGADLPTLQQVTATLDAHS